MKDISRREFLAAGTAIAAAGLSGCRVMHTATEPKPHLLFIFSDQQSYDMLGCYGNEQIITPNIDRLGQEGVRFEHCVSNTPVCSPMRAMLMSGQHPLYNGTFRNDIQMLTHNGPTFAQVLKQHGYWTGYIGKWHLYGGRRPRPIPQGAVRYGFDDLFLSNNCTLDFRPGHSFYYDEHGEPIWFKKWEVYGQAEQAVEVLDKYEGGNPFALFVSFHPPHDQGLSPAGRRYNTEPDLMAMYDRNKIRLRPNVKETPQVREDYHGHMAMCSGVDIAVGQILKKLEEKGLKDNTIVVYTSDHGDLLKSNDRPYPKGFPEDCSARVPFIIRWPRKLRARQTSQLLVGSLDLMPTLLGMMGIRTPSVCQGKDLSRDIFSGREDTVKNIPMFYFVPGWRGLYTRRYTYSFDQFGGKGQISWSALYDKQKDAHQMNNLYGAKSYKTIQDELNRITRQWMEQFEDREIDGYGILKTCGFPSYLDRGSDGNITRAASGPIERIER